MDRFKNYGQQFPASAAADQMQSHSHDLGEEKTINERIDSIANSIASGNNNCGTLVGPDGQINRNFLAASIYPTLKVYEDEARQLRQDKLELSRIAEDRRQGLEMVYSNAAGQLPRLVYERVCKLLGFSPAN
ncbi:MAG: hypothetical protein LUE17_16405 [Planctomycetaceae bacterium]|nr:hypothetical protein [Planctomycetaceae bacterium]